MPSIAVRAGTLLATSALGALVLAGCGGGGHGARRGPLRAQMTVALSSAAFVTGSSIPARYTCDGQDVAPALTWTGVPARAVSLALLVEDRDAPGGDFVHWSVYDLPRGSSGLDGARLPGGSAAGENSFGRRGYGGPCPPRGDPAHRYVFSLYALDERPTLAPGASPDSVRAAITSHAIAVGTLTGLYRR